LRVTIKDVSRAAGVSIKTVSRVLNQERYVGAETRARVEAAVAALNFRPSNAARSLAGRRSWQIALICDNPNPYYVYEMQSGIRDRCEAAGVRMIAQPYDRESPRLIADIEALVDGTGVDGLILTPPVADHPLVLELLGKRGIRFVRVSPGVQPGLAPSVFIDNEAAAAAMTAHLIEAGHRRIAFVAGHRSYATSGQRMSGYLRALQAAGIAIDLELVRQGDFGFESGAQACESLLALASAVSSNPAIARAPGTATPARCAACTAPAAIVSLDANTAVGGLASASRLSHACAPDSKPKSPCRTSSRSIAIPAACSARR
jgi:LacI family transcriptional regulator